MERIKKIAQGTGKTFMALSAVVLMPVLIWVAMGTAVYKKVHKTQTQATFKQALATGKE